VGRRLGRLVGTGTGTVGKVAGDRVGTLEGLQVGGVELGAIVGALEGRRVGRPEGVWVGLNVGEEAALHPGNLKLVMRVVRTLENPDKRSIYHEDSLYPAETHTEFKSIPFFKA